MTEETTRRVVTAEARYKASPPSWRSTCPATDDPNRRTGSRPTS
jgi:hypothetical protein